MAGTSSRSASAPLITAVLVPLSVQPSASPPLAAVAGAAGSQAPAPGRPAARGSPPATAAMTEPPEIPGSHSLFAASSSLANSRPAASTPDASSGDGTSPAPSSRSATARSASDPPLPPYSAGMISPASPRPAAIRAQTSSS